MQTYNTNDVAVTTWQINLLRGDIYDDLVGETSVNRRRCHIDSLRCTYQLILWSEIVTKQIFFLKIIVKLLSKYYWWIFFPSKFKVIYIYRLSEEEVKQKMHAWESEKHATLYEANKFKTRKVISDILKIISHLPPLETLFIYNEILRYITKYTKISVLSFFIVAILSILFFLKLFFFNGNLL
jgi:hypothetical protein